MNKRKLVLLILITMLISSTKILYDKAIHSEVIKASQTSKKIETTTLSNDKPVSSIINTTKKKQNIIIDPGHGGNDLGAVSGNLYEKTINLYIAKRLKEFLVASNYGVLMTREKDEFLASKSNIAGTLEKKDLDARTRIINNSNATIFVSIHVDSLPSEPEINGSVVYYNPNIKESKNLAECIQKELNQVKINNKNRSAGNPNSADFYILKNSNIPGVLIETGFITNKLEKSGFIQSSYKDTLAKSIYTAIEKYNNSNNQKWNAVNK